MAPETLFDHPAEPIRPDAEAGVPESILSSQAQEVVGKQLRLWVEVTQA